MIHRSALELESQWKSRFSFNRAWLRPVVLFSSGLLLLLLSPLAVRAEDPLWGENASTLGKGFVNATTRAGLRTSRPYHPHGGAVEMTMEETSADVVLEYGLEPHVDLRVFLPYFSQSMREEFSGQT